MTSSARARVLAMQGQRAGIVSRVLANLIDFGTVTVIYIVLPLALLFAGIAVWAFIWAVRQGQLDDLETPAARILLDDDDGRSAARRPETMSHRGREGGIAGPPASARR